MCSHNRLSANLHARVVRMWQDRISKYQRRTHMKWSSSGVKYLREGLYLVDDRRRSSLSGIVLQQILKLTTEGLRVVSEAVSF